MDDRCMNASEKSQNKGKKIAITFWGHTIVERWESKRGMRFWSTVDDKNRGRDL